MVRREVQCAIRAKIEANDMTPELAQIASCSIMHPDKQRIAIAECCGWIPHAWRIRLSNEEAMVMIQAKKKTQSG
jgi:hypothetical protein